MANPQGVPELLEWVRFLATIFTPFAVLWLGIRSANRKTLMDTINTQLTEMRKEVAQARAECRQDIQAIIAQMSEYPRRTEMHDSIRDIRDDFRARTEQR